MLWPDSSWVNFTLFQCDGEVQWATVPNVINWKKKKIKISDIEIEILWEFSVRQKPPAYAELEKFCKSCVSFA